MTKPVINRTRPLALGVLAIGLLAHLLARTVFAGTDLGGHTALPARLMRLAGVACIALPLLTLMVGELRLGPGALPPTGTTRSVVNWAERLALFGAALMPTVLLASALVAVDFKYLLAIPATAAWAAALACAWVAFQSRRVPELLMWSTLALSFSMGQLMGMYSFDGPLPTPAFIGSYEAEVRVALRWFHIATASGGVLGLWLTAGARRVVELRRGLAFSAKKPAAMRPAQKAAQAT